MELCQRMFGFVFKSKKVKYCKLTKLFSQQSPSSITFNYDFLLLVNLQLLFSLLFLILLFIISFFMSKQVSPKMDGAISHQSFSYNFNLTTGVLSQGIKLCNGGPGNHHDC